MLKVLIFLQAIVTGWWVYLQFSGDHTLNANYLFNGVYGVIFLYGGVIGSVYAVRLGGLRSTVGRALSLISLALIAYGIGQFIWMYYNLVLHKEVPYPSYADLFFGLTIPVFSLGFWHILKMYRTFLSGKILAQLMIVLFISAGTISVLIGPPDLSGKLDLMSRFLNLYYPLGDALLVSLAFITFRTGGGKIDRSIILYVIGMLLLATADNLFTWRHNNEIYWNGDFSDLLFAFSGFLLSYGVVKTVRSFVK
jgi:hypothetical protein